MDMADMLIGMLNGDRQGLQSNNPTCPNDGSVWSVGYPGCIEKSVIMLPVLTGYRFEDACKAVFCINSWHQNRSAQSCAQSLNAALISAETFGEKPIENYRDFEIFYKEIEKLNPVSFYEDYVIPVMGHTKLQFRGHWWPALYGCGMIHEYSRLCYADPICLEAGKVGEFELLLDYTTLMASILDGGGWNGEDINEISLQLPPESHWNNTNSWFDALPCSRLSSTIINALGNRKKPIEKIHFVEHDGISHSLFNPSILIDYFEFCCELLSENTFVNTIDSFLALNADHIYSSRIFEQTGLFLQPCFKLADEYLENCPVAFMLFDGASGGLTIFYDLSYGDGNLKELRKALIMRTPEIQIIETFERDEGHRALRFGKRCIRDVNLVAFVNDVAPIAAPVYIEASEVADMTCGALDLLSILHASSSIEEINTYFAYLRKSKDELTVGISGIFPHFWNWKDNDHYILAGAEDINNPVSIFCEYNDNDAYYCDFFKGEVSQYPLIDNTYPFGSPFCYRFEENDRGFVAAITKAEGKNTGESKRLNDKPCFLQLCADSSSGADLTREELEREIEAYNLSLDIFEKLVNSLEKDFGELAKDSGGILRFEYVCAANDRIKRFGLIDEELGIRTKALNASFGHVYYTFDRDRFLAALMNSIDRSIECRLGAAIVLSFGESLFAVENLVKAIRSLSHEKKLVDMKGIEIPYVWRRSSNNIKETDSSKKAAIKTVAIAADKAGIQPGVYRGKDANEMLRKFQGSLTDVLKDKLGEHSAKTLIMDIYEVCGSASHEFFMHTNRIRSFTRVDEQEAHRLKDSALDLREDARELIRASRYCIETTLAFGLNGKESPSSSELSYILSLAIQCLRVNDIADMLRFSPKGLSVQVGENKTIRIIEDDNLTSKSRDIKKRSLDDPGHILEDASIDINYIKRSKEAFEKDTGVSFECFLSVLDALAIDVELSDIFSFTRANVVSVSSEDLATNLSEHLKERFDESSVRNCIGFLTIDSDGLNKIDNVALNYVPFCRIKDRPNRLELKPLILCKDSLIYSPICAGLLKMRWIEGVAQRFLPTKSYTSLYEVCRQWKEHYEKALEKDVRDCFLSHGFNKKCVFKSLYLHKRGSHPQNLGDYDGLAYDEQTETVWCIECKEFEKVESSYDSFQLQQRWFGEKGKLQQFEKRVQYLNDHIVQVASDLNFKHSGALKLKPYLVSNKLFMNMIGESNFEVITLNELNELLNEQAHCVESRS